MLRKKLRAALPVCLFLLGPAYATPALAQSRAADAEERASSQSTSSAEPNGLDRRWALGGYASGWAGSYEAVGLGGRLSFRAFSRLGVQVFGESYLVRVPQGHRHDHPVGFDLFVPIRLAENVQLRPLAGFCAVFSFIDSGQDHTPPANDILFGVHGGLGLEWLFQRRLSLFTEVQAIGWLGHGRTSGQWTGGVDGRLRGTGVVQATLGVEIHVGA